jgi:putative methyltransferase (TIGR04325 family)
VLSKNIKFICVDRTPFVSEGGERIMIQNVSEPIYRARYPHRFFEKSKFLANFKNHGYEVLEGFKAIDNGNEFATWEGFIFAKTKSN